MREREFTGIYDSEFNKILSGDIVDLFGKHGEVVFECGAFGIAFDDYIDWDSIEMQIPIVTGCNNSPHFCGNDNFISLWELMWNFNCEENTCGVVKICGRAET